MSRRIRWLGVVITACFVALFVQLNNLQVVKAHQYATAQDNPAVIAAKYDQTRGNIVSADGTVLAQSVPTPKDLYKFQRVYPTGSLFGQITGYFSHQYGTEDGVELSYNSYLLAHNKPVKTLRDLLSTQTVTDTITLTLSDTLQTDAKNALAGRNGAIVVLDPSTGAIEAMYSNPNFDPNPLTSLACAVSTGTGAQQKCTETVAQQAWTAYNTNDSYGFNPLTSLAYQDISPPGSTFKVVTTSAAYARAPQLVNQSVPSFSCIPPGYFQGQTTQLCNDGGTSCGGTISVML
ncbi:MAG: penicillin-binding transpeptidase domain-containing protein, partial [Nitrososphaerales archaeon]